MSYYCSIIEAKNFSAVWRGMGSKHPCVRRHSKCENMVMGKRSASREVTRTMYTQRRVKKLQEKARNLAGGLEKSGRRYWMN